MVVLELADINVNFGHMFNSMWSSSVKCVYRQYVRIVILLGLGLACMREFVLFYITLISVLPSVFIKKILTFWISPIPTL